MRRSSSTPHAAVATSSRSKRMSSPVASAQGFSNSSRAKGVVIPTHLMGVPDEMIPHGSQAQQREWCGLTAEKMVEHARALLGRTAPTAAATLETAGRHD